MCGAAPPIHLDPAQPVGLSPRVWGSLLNVEPFDGPIRSIPTCVGQPHVSVKPLHVSEVYPHVCGAAPWEQESCYVEPGLSPRVWGSPTSCLDAGILSWSIPTCVGQPAGRRSTVPETAVYPHVCGAASDTASTHSSWTGLSPRVWGSPLPETAAWATTWSIPTCVGQPWRRALPVPTARVYPHVCGAAHKHAVESWATEGLSPRVWGSHYVDVIGSCCDGSIPTCVGQPSGALDKEGAA